ncbi:ATP-dependent helicase [Aquabacterium sp.]|uniref:ATP-dependent helicase n=1 Tax=Aquabacterium sp. TaxID=1872578 RepID=UPI002CBCA068|nr:ATP-dependent helicase [Aquabacterium sp.]HSW07547.1 ATP-dependent helicase [Aquabacterium sp.]
MANFEHSEPAAPGDPFADLNPAQREAVEHGIGAENAAPLLVIAGAGSGKTKTLAARVACLVCSGADPQRLLLLTFSRRAAREMVARAGGMLHVALRLPASTAAPVLPWAGTFHGVGARLLRQYAGRIGLSDSFSILDRGDAEDLMALARQACGLAEAGKRFPMKGTCLAIYSCVVNRQASLPEVLQENFPWCADWHDELRRLFAAYAAEKQRQQVLDYDDLLLYWAGMMAEPALAEPIAARFDHVLVDEYQDTNRLQATILNALKPDGHGLTVVGDDAQSIYSFRAAEVRNILEFPQQFAVPARVVTLERNYRSTQPILAASNAVIAQAVERFTKDLWTDRMSSEKPALVTVEDEAAQARWVAERILAHREQGLRLKRQAVLFRASHHSAMLELELTRRNIPFVKFGGLKFLEAAHVKDMLSVLRWAENPRNRLAGHRVALLVAGIGPASARRLMDAMDASAAPREALASFAPPPAAQEAWQALATLVQALQATPEWPAELQQVQAWYRPQLDRLYDDARVRQADLTQLTQIARGYASREKFLTELALDPPQSTSDEAGAPHLDEDYLVLSTIHSAKGQEWQSVHVLNVVDGCIPGDMATGHAAQIEEERRLLYVAMTRARQHLHLLVPQRFYVTQQRPFGDRHMYASLTRFIPPAMADLFDPVAPAVRATPDGVVEASVPAVDLRGRIGSMWQ